MGWWRYATTTAGRAFKGALFVFQSQSRRSLKLLMYDGQGFSCVRKRLSRGRFCRWPSPGERGVCQVSRINCNCCSEWRSEQSCGRTDVATHSPGRLNRQSIAGLHYVLAFHFHPAIL